MIDNHKSEEIDVKKGIREVLALVDVYCGIQEENEKLKLDSIQFAVVLVEIEDRFNISLTTEEILSLQSARFCDYEQLITKKLLVT